jgi:hypothetical protein
VRDPWAILQTTPGVLTDRINVGGNETGSKSQYEGPILETLLVSDETPPQNVVLEATNPEDLEKLPTARDPWAILQSTPGVINDRSKGASEQPILRALTATNERLTDITDEQLRALAQLRRPRIRLDPASRAFLLRKQGVTDSQEAKRLVDTFETTVAFDEVINEYRTGPAILKKLSGSEVWKDHDLEAFNLWVYEEVFRTPLSDPWLGLAPKDVYGALPASMRAAPSK